MNANFLGITDKNEVQMFATLFLCYLIFQLLINFRKQWQYFNTQPLKLYENKIKILGKFTIPTPNKSQFLIYSIALPLTLTLALFNIYPKIFLFLSLIFYFLYFTPITSFPDVQRKTNLIPLVMIILLVSPFFGETLDKKSTNWEIILVKVLIVQMYLSSALQKLKYSGLAWCNGKTLQAYLMESYLYNDNKNAIYISQKLWLCSLLSWFSLVFELSIILMLFLPSLTYVFLLLGILFHLGTKITMQINYLKYLGCTYMIFLTDIAFWIQNKLELL